MIIGVTGNFASGKDSVADILQQMNFFHVSFSDMIREELKKNKIELTRQNLIDKGNELRTKNGANILAQMALTKVLDGENYVFTSIRNPDEVKLLKERGDFILVKVTSPDKVRLQRLVERNREKDPKTLKELREKEKLENSTDPNAQQLNTVAKMAKIELRNDKTLEALDKKVRKLVEDWLYKLQDSRPSWDHYFMEIAEKVKTRCTCLSAKKGTVIVRNKQIISTGYNGTPKGISHCTDGSCPRCTARHMGKVKSGDYPRPCICAHCEENAIVQAAYHGISTKDATLYTTFTPCVTCCKMIINAGIVEVVAKTLYPDDVGIKMLKEAKVKFRVLK